MRQCVTSNAGSLSLESIDGRDLYYLDTATPAALWRQPLAGGAPTRLLDGRTIFFSRTDASADDLMLVEKFK